MRKILVPYDGSAPSLRALAYVAARMQRGEKLVVEVLYVQPLAIPTDFVSASVVRDWQDRETAKILENPRFKKVQRQLKARLHVIIGDTVDKIVKFSRKSHCREIVMGTRGMSRLKGFVMGSIATKVVQLSPLPVTLVK